MMKKDGNILSRDWTPDELAAVSAAMKAAGYMSYEEFCAALAPLLDLQLRSNFRTKMIVGENKNGV